MAYSRQTAVSDGTLITLDISIAYMRRVDLSVLLDGVLTTDWAFLGALNTIVFPAAIPAGGVVTILRATQINKVIHQFALGAKFTSSTVDEDFRQMLYLAQEYTEGAGLSDVFSDLNMHGYRILNLGNGLLPSDAVNLGQLQTAIAAIEPSMLRAELASAVGASLVGYMDATTRTTLQGFLDSLTADGGAAKIGTSGGRKQSDKNNESRSITDFGAKPGNAAYAAINNAAFDAALALGDVFIPEGVFYLNRAVLIPSNRTVYGRGWSSVVKATTDFASLDCPWAGPGGMWFMFANSNIATSGYNEYIEVLNVRSDWSIGPNNCHHFHMRNTQFTSARGNYFISGGDGTAFTLSKYYSVLDNFTWGTRNCCYDQWEGSSNGLVSGNIGFCKFGYGMLATGDTSLNTTGQTDSITFTNNLIFGTSTSDSGVGLWLQSGVNAGSAATRCHASGNRLVGFSIGIRATGGGYHNITNNNIQFCPEAGIVLSAEFGTLGSMANILSGNIIAGCGSATSAPILLQLGSGSNLITGNRVINPAGSAYAVTLSADTGENVVNNNLLDPGTVGIGSDASTRNHCDFDITFTPRLTSSGGGVATYGSVYGKAKKIGGRVHFNVRINLTGLGTLAAGSLQIAGLPVLSANDDANDISIVNAQFGSIVSATTQPNAQVPANSSAIVLLKWNLTGNATLAVADITGTSVITISGSYRY